jgi:hypothetical protein
MNMRFFIVCRLRPFILKAALRRFALKAGRWRYGAPRLRLLDVAFRTNTARSGGRLPRPTSTASACDRRCDFPTRFFSPVKAGRPAQSCGYELSLA